MHRYSMKLMLNSSVVLKHQQAGAVAILYKIFFCRVSTLFQCGTKAWFQHVQYAGVHAVFGVFAYEHY